MSKFTNIATTLALLLFIFSYCLFSYVKDTECGSTATVFKNNLEEARSCEVFLSPTSIYFQVLNDSYTAIKMVLKCRSLTSKALENSFICVFVFVIIQCDRNRNEVNGTERKKRYLSMFINLALVSTMLANNLDNKVT
ncbi:hypothetical protein PPL_01685 [Heterostelium album PN500]|uniref:Transmembrane protein n=1 Tax=Heterostelium pallidum (strain ATCC 26659 / Pp 5 / PN500) TaxID=670386 RepID=D3B069_HETP5|nr:hypothetical protein PPL_01685 [Heterostelium album PN500]EFA84693.1 hypothetical protein PPL_01685 [Heterostelium album PN500]|eukprot:XP_020436806.1 hypothetical protein PPL_01685 [Heterostelium album PN500]